MTGMALVLSFILLAGANTGVIAESQSHDHRKQSGADTRGNRPNQPGNPHDHRGETMAKRCVPGPNQVTVFQHPKYKGVCSVLDEGWYESSLEMNMANDTISSIKLGRNMQIYACHHSRRKGTGGKGFVGGLVGGSALEKKKNKRRCETFRQSVLDLRSGKHLIADNAISFAVVKPTTWDRAKKDGSCNPGSHTDAVAVYEYPNLKGNCRVLGVGTYVGSKQLKFKNDSMSSIDFARNPSVSAELCTNSNFRGKCETFRVTDLDYKDNVVYDNRVISMKVSRNPSKPKPEPKSGVSFGDDSATAVK